MSEMPKNLADTMPFSRLMGVSITDASAERVTGELVVRDDLCTTNNIMHGGAIMAFADALGAVGAFLSLPKGANGTTTIESKTNFLGAAKQGSTVTGVTKPVKIGGRMSVWQTEIRTQADKQVALITQTQLVL
ncbi:PaaI family thioesterase [Alterisphingorhabdus coralli]|uniref:PaaI family thioesterase n=1 Tax=Alterisphingorhabdus coralli TaxID=3071408 RepID=A0AA97F9Z4_9SPHN|nr:PaaI family thioesterase [Parasphingorhabdus sp. SCSIO 66989]WOE75777.1 PaaI family thioesterase [Parasphingorhabdus sp. SCSIO 66989]